MRALHPQPGLEDFFRRLQTAPERVLLLDYDGTLAPFRIRMDEALPYPGVRDALDAIMESGHTRLVIVSGRWTRDLQPLLGLKSLPEIWGSHGWEQLRPDGEYVVARMDEDALRHLADADTWTAEIEAQGGRCEIKPGGLAIHWRGLDQDRIADIRSLVFQNLLMKEMQKTLVWHDFDGGIELRVPGRHKGFVVDTVLSGMRPDTAAAYLGDDNTDEDAFQAIRGRGIGVLVRPQYRATAADFWLKPPQELLEFLQRWHEPGGSKG
ncbi:MAG TPA: trehalose-phosphatase [Sulfuricaulis sp.]|nr:trehalose-phosphatase [Sulfuricaulis sp.]